MKLFKSNIIQKIKSIFRRDVIKNRKVSKARFLYLYIIFGSILGLVYFVVSVFKGWPKHFALSFVYLFVSYLIFLFLYRNWRAIWFYVVNVERGKFVLFLNRATHWEESHKLKVAKWVYPGYRKIRREVYDKISKKVMDGEDLTKDEKKRLKHKVVFCPQQVKLGFSEALLVHALIHAHRNILPLDDEIRDIMNLTDDNILKFDLRREYKKAGGDEYDKLIEIGKRKSEELNN